MTAFCTPFPHSVKRILNSSAVPSLPSTAWLRSSTCDMCLRNPKAFIFSTWLFPKTQNKNSGLFLITTLLWSIGNPTYIVCYPRSCCMFNQSFSNQIQQNLKINLVFTLLDFSHPEKTPVSLSEQSWPYQIPSGTRVLYLVTRTSVGILSQPKPNPHLTCALDPGRNRKQRIPKFRMP